MVWDRDGNSGSGIFLHEFNILQVVGDRQPYE